jgi:hypothetical protein
VTALGNQAHMFARPYRRKELIWCSGSVLGCGPVTSIPHPAIPEPMLLISFPGGGHLAAHSCHHFVRSLPAPSAF